MKSVVLTILVAAAAVTQAARPVEEFTTSSGPVQITIVNHASMLVQGAEQVIAIDPVGSSRYDPLPAADVILITHTHPDHLDPAAIAKLRKAGTVVVGPKTVADGLLGAAVMRNGETRRIGQWSIEAVPAYNLKRGPSAGTFFHPKGDGNGYVLSFGGRRFYVAGDTENIPEMANLKNIDAAFLPMNLPYTMTPEEAADAVRSFKPKTVYPYHSRGTDVAAFAKALDGSGVEVRQRNWYQAEDEPAAGAGGGGRGGRGGAAAGRGAAVAPPPEPEVLPDHRVVFRINAPKASEVAINGEFWLQQGRTEKLTKDERGTWALTVGPLVPGVYPYWFIVDGVNTADPVNGWIKPGSRTTQNWFEVPGPEGAWEEVQNVPHGDVRMMPDSSVPWETMS